MNNKHFATAVLVVAAFHGNISNNKNNLGVDALPSFGQKIPNGEKVPCPTSTSTGTNGCTASGFCFGLGHLDCGGFKQDDKIVTVEDTTSSTTSTILLNPFGDDWRSNGFVWTKKLCQMDSDGDGFTNGEELGDPCCVWTIGSGPPGLNALSSADADADALSSTGFIPSHPGLKDEIPPQGFVLDKAAFCAGVVVEDDEEEGNDTNTDNNADNESMDIDYIMDTNYTQSAYDVSSSAYDSRYDRYYNTNEERGAFEFRIQPYPIPIKTTTYIDFVFNLPEDLPDFVHVVFAETIVSQPDHLHHFVLTGCTDRVDANREGVPLDDVSPRDCMVRLGGWAPGMDVFGAPHLDSGLVMGRGMGIVALHLNVHYTDGIYEDDASELHRIATDGMKILYTTDFRPNSSIGKSLIWVPWGPKSMVVPPGESRYFLSRTCKIKTSCKDVRDEQLSMMANFMGLGGGGGGNRRDSGDDTSSDGDDTGASASANSGPTLSCASLAPLCFMGNELTGYIQQHCPVTCGLCGEDDNDNKNYRNPDSYRVTGIHYHAHLLGSEMYATLLREQETGSDAAAAAAVSSSIQKKQQQAMVLNEALTAKDLKSREIWHYDDQASIPMDYDVFTAANSDIGNSENSNTATTTTTTTTVLKQGVYVKHGDKIQVACVYDSTGRAEATSFGSSTYQEMCIVTVYVSFPTPPAMMGVLDSEGASKIQTTVDLNLRLFQCDVDDEFHTSDVYQGFLEQEEDGRNIWSEHPIQDSQLCTFPVQDFEALIGTSFLSMDGRNCPVSQEGEGDETDMCHGYESDESAFSPNAIAGFLCYGGEFDQQDSNEAFGNVSSSKCLEDGGGTEYKSYSCLDAHYWMKQEEPDDEDYVYSVWQPLCCDVVDGDGDGDGVKQVEEAEQTKPKVSSSSMLVFTDLSALGFLLALLVGIAY